MAVVDVNGKRVRRHLNQLWRRRTRPEYPEEADIEDLLPASSDIIEPSPSVLDPSTAKSPIPGKSKSPAQESSTSPTENDPVQVPSETAEVAAQPDRLLSESSAAAVMQEPSTGTPRVRKQPARAAEGVSDYAILAGLRRLWPQTD